MQRKPKPLLARQLAILKTQWPQLEGKSRSEVKELQDRYFQDTRQQNDKDCLDDYSDRDKQWKVLWHRRDRAEDRELALEGKEGQHTSHEAKTMEYAVQRRKKAKKTHTVQPDNVLVCSWQQPTTPADGDDETDGQIREQCRMVKDLEKQQLSSAAFDRTTSTWLVKVTQTDAALLGVWFATAQKGRNSKTDWKVKVGDIWLKGYGPWKGALGMPDHNQKRVTLVGDLKELDALREHAPGFAKVYTVTGSNRRQATLLLVPALTDRCSSVSRAGSMTQSPQRVSSPASQTCSA